jgi:polyhydroxyalkanoate synthase
MTSPTMTGAKSVSKDQPAIAAPTREGPRPFGFHVMAITTANFGAMAAMPSAKLGLFPWHSSVRLEADALMGESSTFANLDIGETVARVATDRLALWLKGVEAYRAHPYERVLKDPPVVWRSGTTRLFDYGAPAKKGNAAPVTALFVPSLVNPSYVLDLRPGRSGMRYLHERGIRPLLIDWGAPADEERGFDLGDYVIKRLEPALDKVLEIAGGPVALVGYCMGGNLALALAQRRQDHITRLGLLATPWDFHLHIGAPPFAETIELDQFATLPGGRGEVPVDVLQIFFAMLDPTLVERKFRHFAELDPTSPEALDFVAVEDWANDGMPLALPAANECFYGWYGMNTPMRGAWKIDGEPVAPKAIRVPTLFALPSRDRIVPYESALALAEAIEGATIIRPPSGHVGMILGSRAETGLWRPLANWLLDL